MAIITVPTFEELDRAFHPYVTAVGKVVHSWNNLHQRLGQLYVIVDGGDRQIALNRWYAIFSDSSQRKKLRKLITGLPLDYWLPRLPLARDDLIWLLDEIDAMADHRNNAVHAPCTAGTDGRGTFMIAAYFSGHPRAVKLQGVDLVKEFNWIDSRTDELTQIVEKMETSLGHSSYDWPSRPNLPARL